MPLFIRLTSQFFVPFFLLVMYANAATIDWDHDSVVQIDTLGLYGRMIWLDDGSLLVSYEKSGKTWVRKSTDSGGTWSNRILAAQAINIAANPEILQLQNGTILQLFNDRPWDDINPFAIRLVKSTDGGLSWSNPELVYEGGPLNGTSVAEPAAIQLPSGEIQLFFANESVYPNSHEQEITMVRSFDNAVIWQTPETVSFRAGHRDGMPVPLILANGQGIVFSIEDNGVTSNRKFKLSIVYTSMEDNWNLPPADGDSSRRWVANQPPLDAEINAAAPYLAQLPSGHTLLSTQEDESGRNLMSVFIGDDMAQNFSHGTRPFEFMSAQRKNLWTSLFVKDDDTVTAIAGIVNLDGTNEGLWAIDGHFVPDSADFDNDNDVDGADFFIWQRNYLISNASHSQGDADWDSLVDSLDLGIWGQQFSSLPPTAVGQSVAVPEPASVMLMTLFGLGLITRRRVCFRHQSCFP